MTTAASTMPRPVDAWGDGWHQPCILWDYWQEGEVVARIRLNEDGCYSWLLTGYGAQGVGVDTLAEAQDLAEEAWRQVTA